MSLGPFPEISLDEARARHAALRKKVIADKVDPMAEKERVKAKAPADAPGVVPTFGKVADAYIAAHEKGWRNPKHSQQWAMTLTKYCAPIRSTPVDKVDVKAILRVLEPIWTRAPETASRLRGRIEAVLAAAQVAGHNDPDKPNPARWKGWLDHMLANPKKIGERGNHAAMDWRDVPAFVAKLRTMGFARQRGARVRHPVREPHQRGARHDVERGRPRRGHVDDPEGADEDGPPA
jgi:hypothetical protein